MEHLNVILVDNNIAFRDALKLLLVKEHNVSIVNVLTNISDLFNENQLFRTQMIIINFSMLDKEDSKIANQFILDYPDITFLAISNYTELNLVKGIYDWGFATCIDVDNCFAEISLALENVKKGKYNIQKILFDKKEGL